MQEGNSIKNSELKTIEAQADEILAVLEIDAPIPEGLIEKVILKKETIKVAKVSKFDFSKYLQIAAVFAAAILIGILMGKNADSTTFNKTLTKEKQALIELRNKHHLSERSSFGRL